MRRGCGKRRKWKEWGRKEDAVRGGMEKERQERDGRRVGRPRGDASTGWTRREG